MLNLPPRLRRTGGRDARHGPARPGVALSVAVAQVRPLVETLVTGLAVVLDKTHWSLSGEAEVEVGGVKVTASKQSLLTDALAPLAAKSSPTTANTPEAYAAVAVCAIFGPPALSLAMERVGAIIERRQAAQVGA